MKILELSLEQKKTNLARKMQKEITDEGKASVRVIFNTKKSIQKLFDDLAKLAFSLGKNERRKDQTAKATARTILQDVLDNTK